MPPKAYSLHFRWIFSLNSLINSPLSINAAYNYPIYRSLSTKEDRVFSGIQPTGTLHIGNYFGAVKKWVELQESSDSVLYSIVDLHSITLPQDPQVLKKNILEVTASLLSCGISPEKSILFQQSMVPQHTELSWVLGCMTTMARLGHLPQYKEKSASLKEIPLGLFIYPVLQSADILIYKANKVPVGEDQLQHLQLAQHLANLFNKRFGKFFPHPKALISDGSSARVKSLRNPTKKMSKSDVDPKSRIELADTDDQIVNKVKKALTDFTSEVTWDPEGRPGVANIIAIHSAMTGKDPERIVEEAVGLETAQYKLVAAEAICEGIRPIRTKINELLKEPQYLHQVLADGAEKASNIAAITWDGVRKLVGLSH
ncbi:tryptophan--tRNA ligase, mitochondrial [Ischnura elegans]|uniref:tryptophan--tRNA ligase, mitochondrial n=1 Tax=Ischnura elegans TaxID=197161 RepID=UPI001ED8A79B|nr:tryptophan--tRNA ligase, mitochondrial [Ischnura elegans]